MLGHFAFSDQSENRGATQGYASEARRFSVLAASGCTPDSDRCSYSYTATLPHGFSCFSGIWIHFDDWVKIEDFLSQGPSCYSLDR